MAAITLSAVRHVYPRAEEPALADVDLTIADGEAHALLGPSGSGKTTLLNVLSGLLAPSDGEVRLGDANVTFVPPQARHVAQVFQFPVVYDAMSVRANLAFPLRNRRFPTGEIHRRVEEVAELLEITPVLGSRPRTLSAYDRQKVAMARGLVRPDVSAVLLDEPLTAVEPAAKWRLRRALKRIQRERGLTMVYVTHDQLEALTFAERVSVMRAGRVLQTDAPQALVDDPQHAFVGHFVGSPGMNLLPARVAGRRLELPGGALPAPEGIADGPCEAGFRPEDAEIVAADANAAGALTVTLTGSRPLALRAGTSWGVVTAELGGHPLAVRQRLDALPARTGALRVRPERLRVFRDGWRAGGRAHRPSPCDTDHRSAHA